MRVKELPPPVRRAVRRATERHYNECKLVAGGSHGEDDVVVKAERTKYLSKLLNNTSTRGIDHHPRATKSGPPIYPATRSFGMSQATETDFLDSGGTS